MATAATRTSIIQLVVLANNQAPGTTLLTELVVASDSGQSLTQIAATLTGSAAFQAKYPVFQTPEEFGTEFINDIIPSASAEVRADAAQIAASLINGGATRAEVLLAATEFLATAPTTDPSFGTAAATFQNEVTVATYHTVTLELDTNLDTALAGVTDDAATVTAAQETLDNAPVVVPVAQTFTLVSSLDNITGTSANEAVSAILSNTTADNTWNIADTIDLAGGTDSINARIINDGNTFSGRTSSGAETINLTMVDTSTTGQTSTVSASGFSGATQVWAKDGTVSGTNDDTLAITGIASSATVGIANNDSDLDVSFTNSGSATSGDSITLAAGGGATGDVTLNDAAGDGFATVNIATSADTTVSSLAAGTDFATLNITGSHALTIGGVLASTVKTIDASASTGALRATAVASSTSSFKGGSATTDLLSLNLSSSIGSGNSFAVSGFETVLAFSSAGASLDVTGITGATTFGLVSASTNTGSVTLDKVTADSIAFIGTGASTGNQTFNGLTYNRATDGTADAVTVSVSNGGAASTGTASVGSLDLDDDETATVNFADFKAVTVADFVDSDTKSLTLSGSGDITFTALQALDGTTDVLTEIDGSALTGKFTLGTAGLADFAAAITSIAFSSGAGADTIQTGIGDATADIMTYNTNAGNDTVTLTQAVAGTVTVNTGAGDDKVSATLGASLNNGGTVSINGGEGTDRLTLVSGNFTHNFESFAGFEELVLDTSGGAPTYNFKVTNYAETMEVTDVSGQTVTLDFQAGSAGTSINLSNLTFIGWTSGTDVLEITGTTGAETITGSSVTDTINGMGGNDTITITDSTDVRDVITVGAGLDTITGFDVGGAATDDDVIVDISDAEATIGNSADLITGQGVSVANGNAVSFLTITAATDVDASTANVIVANLAGNIASTDALETALEVGGGLALTSGTGALAANDTILVLYDDGTDSYLAGVRTIAGNTNGNTFASGDLVATNLVKFTGISDVSTINAADFGAFAT